MDSEAHPVLQALRATASTIGEAIAADRMKWGGQAIERHAHLGLAELGQAFTFEGSNIAQPSTAALTPADIAEDRGLYGRGDVTALYGEHIPLSPAAIADGNAAGAAEHAHGLDHVHRRTR